MDKAQEMKDRGLKIGLVDPGRVAGMSGFDMVIGMGSGELPLPPMAEVLPVFPEDCTPGRAVFRAWPEQRFYNPMGSVHGGWSMTMLDTAMGVAAHSTLKQGERYASLDTAVRFVRPIFEKTGALRIIGEVVSRGRTVITVEGRIENEDGKIFSHGTSSCMVMSAG